MDVLETWIVFGVPGLLIAACMFVGSSARRTFFGYAALLGTLVLLVTVPAQPDPISAVVVGLILVVLVASGRGQTDATFREHHQHRERFTVAKR